MSDNSPPEMFEDWFYTELDRYFTADIACCDQCYDKYSELWALLEIFDENHQFIGWSIDQIYSNSRLPQLCSKQEYEKWVQTITCPYCSKPLSEMIWVYNLPFSVPERFENDVAVIHRLSQTTPFLVAIQPFAHHVQSEIREAIEKLPLSLLNGCFYRGRKASEFPGAVNPKDADLLPPPAELTNEGRYNHAGRPVLYLGSDRDTCFNELGKPEEGIWVAEVEFVRPVRLLDLTFHNKKLSDCLASVACSSLISAPTKGKGWDNPEYTFSRFVADCARFEGYDGIIYHSIKALQGLNLVVFGWPNDWSEIVNLGSVSQFSQR